MGPGDWLIWEEAFGSSKFSLKELNGFKSILEISSVYVKHLLLKLSFIKINENLHKNVNENMFSFTFLFKFSLICNFAIFGQIFMKFSPKCRTRKLGMINTILGSFCSFF